MEGYTGTAFESYDRECSFVRGLDSRAPLAFEDSSQLDGSRLLSLESSQGRQRGGSSQHSSAYRSGPFYHRPQTGSSRDHEMISSRASLPDEHIQRHQFDVASSDPQTVAPAAENNGSGEAGGQQQLNPHRPAMGTASPTSNTDSRFPWFRKNIRRPFSRLLIKVRHNSKKVARGVRVLRRMKWVKDNSSAEPIKQPERTPDVTSGVVYRTPKEDVAKPCSICQRPLKEIPTEATGPGEQERIFICRHCSDTSSLELMDSLTSSRSQSPEQSSGPGSVRSPLEVPLDVRFTLGGQSQSLDNLTPRGSEFSLGEHDSQAPTVVDGVGPGPNASGGDITRYDGPTERRDVANEHI